MENVEFCNGYKYLITFYLKNTCTFHSVTIAYRSYLLSLDRGGIHGLWQRDIPQTSKLNFRHSQLPPPPL
jgi:hypothetical protein